jgi:hypothetical protein
MLTLFLNKAKVKVKQNQTQLNLFHPALQFGGKVQKVNALLNQNLNLQFNTKQLQNKTLLNP